MLEKLPDQDAPLSDEELERKAQAARDAWEARKRPSTKPLVPYTKFNPEHVAGFVSNEVLEAERPAFLKRRQDAEQEARWRAVSDLPYVLSDSELAARALEVGENNTEKRTVEERMAERMRTPTEEKLLIAKSQLDLIEAQFEVVKNMAKNNEEEQADAYLNWTEDIAGYGKLLQAYESSLKSIGTLSDQEKRNLDALISINGPLEKELAMLRIYTEEVRERRFGKEA